MPAVIDPSGQTVAPAEAANATQTDIKPKDPLQDIRTAPQQQDGAVDRLQRVWSSSKQTIPTDVALALAQSGISDHELARAAVHLARWYDVPPAYMMRPVAGANPVTGVPVTYYQDPASGQLLTLASARRVLRPEEPAFFANALANYLNQQGALPAQQKVGLQAAAARGIAPTDVQRAATPQLLAQVVKALRPIDGNQIDFTTAIGAALQIITDGTPLKAFTTNVAIAAGARGLTASQQIAIAHDAAQKRITWANENDLLAYLSPTIGAAYRDLQASSGAALKQIADIKAQVALFEKTNGTQGISPDVGDQQMNAVYAANPQLAKAQAAYAGATHASTAGGTAATTNVDYGAQLRTALDAKNQLYQVQAEGISSQMVLDAAAFGKSFIGHYGGDALKWIGDGIRGTFAGIMAVGGAGGTLLGAPIATAFGKGTFGENLQYGFHNTWQDSQDIWHGNTTEGQLFAQSFFGGPQGAGLLGTQPGVEKWLASAFDLYTQWYISPDAVLGRGIGIFHELSTAEHAGSYLDGLLRVAGVQSDVGTIDQWKSVAQHFVDNSRLLLGGKTIVQKTLEVLKTSDNPELAWARFRDQMWMRYGNAAVDSRVMNSMWDFVHATQSTASDAELTQGIRDVWLAGFGAKPYTGSTAEAILQRSSTLENPAIQQNLLDSITNATTEEAAQAALKMAEQNATYASTTLDELDMAFGLTANGFTRAPRILQETPNISLGHDIAQAIGNSAPFQTRAGAALKHVFSRMPGPVFNLEDRYAQNISDYMTAAPTRPWTAAEVAKERMVADQIASNLSDPAREAKFLGHTERIQKETTVRMARSLGYSEQDALAIAEQGAQKMRANNAMFKDQIYGVTPAQLGTGEGITSPIVASQLLNQYVAVDPVTVYKALAHHASIAKRIDALALRSTMPGVGKLETSARGFGFTDLGAAMDAAKSGTTDLADLEQRFLLADNAAALPDPSAFYSDVSRLNKQVATASAHRSIAGVLSDTNAVVADDFNRLWKPLAVLRPAYVIRGPFLAEQLQTFARVGFLAKMRGYLRDVVDEESNRLLGAGQHGGIPIGHLRPIQRVESGLYHALPSEQIPVSLSGMVGSLGADVVDPLTAVVKQAGFSDLPAALDTLKQADAGVADAQTAIAKLSEPDLASLRALAANAPRDITLQLPPLLYPTDEAMAAGGANYRAFERIQSSATRDANRLVDGGGYAMLQPDHPLAPAAWSSALNDQIAQTEMGRYALGQVQRGIPLDQRVNDMLSWMGTNDPLAQIANRELARMGEEDATLAVHKLTEVVDNYTTGSADIAHAALGHEVTPNLYSQLENKPVVHGPRSAMVSGAKHPMSTFKDYMGNWLMQAPHDALNRQPLYKTVKDAAARSMLQHAAQSGETITPEFLSRVQQEAHTAAIGEIRRTLIDYSQTNRLEEMFSFVAPFFKPYEMTFLRWGKLLKDNPALFAYARMLDQAGHESGFITKDPTTGQDVIPLSWWMGAAPLLQHLYHVGGWQLSAPLASLNLFFSDTLKVGAGKDGTGGIPIPVPGLSPPALLVLQHVLTNDKLPIPNAVRTTLTPWAFHYGQESAVSALPSWLKYAMIGAGVGSPGGAGWSAAQQINFLRMQQYMGITADSLMAQDPTLTRDAAEAQLTAMAARQAQEYGVMRAFMGAFFPAAPTVNFPQQPLEDELNNLLQTYPNDAAKAYRIFNREHPGNDLITISKTIINTDNANAPAVRVPATTAAGRVMATPGFKAFAKQYPQWVWAIIPPEASNGTFDPGVYFNQLATGMIKYRTPTEFLQAADLKAAWDQYWPIHDAWQAQSEALTTQGYSSTDPYYQQQKQLNYDGPLHELSQTYPAWGRNFGPDATSLTLTLGLDPHVLSTARSLMNNATFMNAPSGIGQALQSYLNLRDKVYGELRANNISSIGNADATTLGFAQEYNDGLANIYKQYPNSNFKAAYQAFFTADLRKITTAGTSVLKQVAGDPAKQQAFQTWRSQWVNLNQQVKLAPSQGAQDALYQQMNQLSDEAFTQTPGFNPQMVWWNTRTPGEQQTYKMSLYSRPYEFLSRFDRQVVLGDTVTNQSESEWAQIGQIQSVIGTMKDQGKSGLTAAYGLIDQKVAAFAAADPVFRAQVQHANTWGYGFFHTTPYLDPGHTTVQTWGLWQDAVTKFQQIADQFQLSGSGSFDPAKKAAYAVLKQQATTYLSQLEASDPQFAREVADIDTTNGTTRFIDYFIPSSYFPLAGWAKGSGAVIPGVPPA